MERRDTQIWEGQDSEATESATVRRRDTDLSELSVRRSRRRSMHEEADAAAFERAPWEEPADVCHESGESATEVPKKKENMLVSLLSGNILSKSEVARAYPYMIFVACLMFLYIANIFRTQFIYREHAQLTEQVKELRARSMTIASEKMQATRQSSIMVELGRRGIPLRESLAPNKVIPNPRQDGTQANDR